MTVAQPWLKWQGSCDNRFKKRAFWSRCCGRSTSADVQHRSPSETGFLFKCYVSVIPCSWGNVTFKGEPGNFVQEASVLLGKELQFVDTLLTYTPYTHVYMPFMCINIIYTYILVTYTRVYAVVW